MRLRLGEGLAAAGALALLVVMFMGWYGAKAQPAGDTLNAWEAFAVTDLVLAAVCLLALALAVAQVTQRAPALPVAFGVLASAASIVALVLLAYRILNEPGPDDLVEVRAGAWLGFAALALVAAGAWRSIGDETPVAGDEGAVSVERRPAPGA